MRYITTDMPLVVLVQYSKGSVWNVNWAVRMACQLETRRSCGFHKFCYGFCNFLLHLLNTQFCQDFTNGQTNWKCADCARHHLATGVDSLPFGLLKFNAIFYYFSFSDNFLQDAFFFFKKSDNFEITYTKHAQSWFEVQFLLYLN